MNKRHWLGITLDTDVPDDVIKRILSDGYSLIVSKLPKKKREELGL